MNIALDTGEIITDVRKAESAEDLLSAKEIWYELGEYERYSHKLGRWINWERSGVFTTIRKETISKHFDFAPDMYTKEYLDHHNFHIK